MNSWIWIVGAWSFACITAAMYAKSNVRSPSLGALAFEALALAIFSACWPVVAVLWVGRHIRPALLALRARLTGGNP